MIVYSWGQNIVWKELIIDGQPRMLVVKYKFFSVMFIIMVAHSKSYFLQREGVEFDFSNPNLLTDRSMQEITPERLRMINNGKLVSVGWWKNWSLLLAVWVLIVGVIIGSYGSKPSINTSNQNINSQSSQTKNRDVVVTDGLVDTTQKFAGVNGVEFVKPIWGLEDIDDYLLQTESKTYNLEDVAFIYTKTSQPIFNHFVDSITKNKTEAQLEKSSSFQKSAREMGMFMQNFPTAFASYELNQESVKNYFFNDTQKLEKITFSQYRYATEVIREKGQKTKNIYTLKSFGQVFELITDPVDDSKIISFKMLDQNDKKPNDVAI
jgi:hypothetical protein